MFKSNITNPVYKDLLKFQIVKKKNIEILFKKTRDKNVRVLRDARSNVIFLEKNLTNLLKYKINPDKRYFNLVKNYKHIKKNIILDDDKRRFIQFRKNILNKIVLDYGCGWGGFLSLTKKISKKSEGYEIMEKCRNYIRQKNLFDLNENRNSLKNKKFDTIFLMHVLEHMPNQISELSFLRKCLNKNGKLIVEVPHALDILITNNELNSFKSFTFWSEHLVLHTKYSLKIFLKKSGFRNIKIINFQRYDFNNHLKWLIKNQPNGHKEPLFKMNKKIIKIYENFLKKSNSTDTLIAVASK